MASVRRKGTSASLDLAIFEVIFSEISDETQLPKYVQVHLDHNNRHLKSSCKAFQSNSSTDAGGTVKKLTWTPPETISLPTTLYGGDSGPGSDEKELNFSKKSWKLQLFGYDDVDGRRQKTLLGKTTIDLGQQVTSKGSSAVETLEMSEGPSGFQCGLKTCLRVVVDGDDKDKAKAKPKVTRLMSSSAKNSCVLLLGTTGTGKTSTLNIYTGNHLPTGNDAQSVTETTTMCKDLTHDGGPAWIDNPGWSDTAGRSDASTFKELLRFLQDRSLYSLKCVIWCVLPQPRMDTTLQSQAEFIDQLTMDEDHGRIWSNVLIVAKAGHEAEEDCLGAKMAAKKVYVHAEPKMISYEFCDDPEVLAGTPTKLRVDNLRMLTDGEIRGELEKTLGQMGPPVQVVFANQRCQDCGQTGDPRLMDDRCHKEKTLGHTGTLEQRFPKLQVALSVAGSALGAVGLGAVALTGADAALAALPVVLAPGSFCAMHRLLNSESGDDSRKCRILDMRYTCCRKGEKNEGCAFKCGECDKLWGNGPPCVLIKHPDPNAANAMEEYEVFRKEHSLVTIEDGEGEDDDDRNGGQKKS